MTNCGQVLRVWMIPQDFTMPTIRWNYYPFPSNKPNDKTASAWDTQKHHLVKFRWLSRKRRITDHSSINFLHTVF